MRVHFQTRIKLCACEQVRNFGRMQGCGGQEPPGRVSGAKKAAEGLHAAQRGQYMQRHWGSQHGALRGCRAESDGRALWRPGACTQEQASGVLHQTARGHHSRGCWETPPSAAPSMDRRRAQLGVTESTESVKATELKPLSFPSFYPGSLQDSHGRLES